VITGGQALEDTLKGFADLAATTSDRSIVIWLNQYFGRIEHAGKTFTEMIVFEENHHKLLGSIGVPKRNQDTFGRDVEEMIARKQTFDEAIQSSDFSIMTKQRLKVGQRDRDIARPHPYLSLPAYTAHPRRSVHDFALLQFRRAQSLKNGSTVPLSLIMSGLP